MGLEHRGRLVAASAILVLAASSARSQTIRTYDFTHAEGVNTHLKYTDGGYNSVVNVVNDLNYLGIQQVRDSFSWSSSKGVAGIGHYEAVAQAGMTFDITIAAGGSLAAVTSSTDDPSLAERIDWIETLEAAVPGSVKAIEGANEVNNWPVAFDGYGTTYKGTDELDAALLLQQALYLDVRGSATLHDLPVYYFTGYNAGTVPVGPDPATTASLADYDTQHPYPNKGEPPDLWVARSVALGNETAADDAAEKPAVYTETGYNSLGGVKGGVSPAVQARYTLDLLLDDAASGISQTYLYQLLDAYAPGSAQGDDGFGLFDYTGAAKPVAVAIHNLNTLLADNAGSAGTFTPTTLSYTVSGEPATGHHVLMQKSNGTYVLALWDERPIWNGTTGTAVAVSAYAVHVTFTDGNVYKVLGYNPVGGTSPIINMVGEGLKVSLNGSPVLLEITASP